MNKVANVKVVCLIRAVRWQLSGDIELIYIINNHTLWLYIEVELLYTWLNFYFKVWEVCIIHNIEMV